ncbi:MAG: ABC transporter ATP-binding protein [Candidatus Nomurabacteria bacterium]|nr:MAG: ABC transporter ATP-binding protein [Candidatus Nomurabacteria bacterium]
MRTLLRFVRPYTWTIVLLVGFVYASVAANLALPDYMANIINNGIVGKDIGLVWRTGLEMLAISLGGAAASFFVTLLASRIASGFSRDVREALFSKIESFSLSEFNTFSTASLITRSTNDVQQLQTVLVILLRMALMAPIMGIWAIIKAYTNAPSMTWLMGLAVGVLLVIISVILAIAIPKFTALQKLVDKLNLVTRELLTGLRVIRAFHREEAEETKFDKANVELTQLNLFVNRLMILLQPIMIFIMNVTTLAIVWYGAKLVDAGDLQIGQMIAFMQYAMQAVFAFLLITMVFIMVPRASVSAKRIGEVLRTKATILDPEKPEQVEKLQNGKVEFDHVTFSYGQADTPVLHDISFTAESNQTTAFIGSTGSGKSTLINLIPRFYDVSSGAIRIDGLDIRQLRQEDLYSRIGFVPQKGVLFSGTVRSNLTYGAPDASEEEIRRVAHIAQADEFIEKLEGAYGAPISQGGTNVSGGQKQRLSIARAILHKPLIYIFDDSFSALDFATDAKLRNALRNETRNKTVLIVAQRISTIMNADKIVVLNEGRIVGQGKHAELMETCQVYREIALSQLSEEELQGSGIKTLSAANA